MLLVSTDRSPPMLQLIIYIPQRDTVCHAHPTDRHCQAGHYNSLYMGIFILKGFYIAKIGFYSVLHIKRLYDFDRSSIIIAKTLGYNVLLYINSLVLIIKFGAYK